MFCHHWQPAPLDGPGPGDTWNFVFASPNPGDLAAFTDGTYTLDPDFATGDLVNTQFTYTAAAPAQAPDFVTPVDGATDVPLGTNFQWDPVTDPNIDSVGLVVFGPDGEVLNNPNIAPAIQAGCTPRREK